MPRLPNPSWYGERRVLEAGVPTVTLSIVSASAPVVVVGGAGTQAAAPLLPEMLSTANLSVRNDPESPALELQGSVTLFVHGNVVGLGLDDVGILTLAPGNELTIEAGRSRVRYLAVAGGVNLAALSGLRAPLVAGDTVLPGTSLGVLTRIPPTVDLRPDAPVRVSRVTSDRFEDGAFAALTSTALTAGAADRSALRLGTVKALTPRAGAGGGPVTPGTVVVSPAGEVIVVGPDHPAASAYPAIAEVAAADRPSLWARPAGAAIRFSASA